MSTQTTPDWSIQQIARLAGTTSRTLRHYDDIGLLPPSRIAANGYRHYDDAALVRLQRILLLRDLGLGLDDIARVLDAEGNAASALSTHRDLLVAERDRITRQIAAVDTTITALTNGEPLMADTMFDGFDHTQHQAEVTERWGEKAYADGDRWWRSMTADERTAWQQRVAQLSTDWVDAAERGEAPTSDAAQELARRHVEWLRGIPGTPAAGPAAHIKEYVLGLGEMYVADPRFGANYATADGTARGAEFVRDALAHFAEQNL